MNGTTVKFNCHGCGEPVEVGSDLVRITLDPTCPSVVVVLETCEEGHAREQRLNLAEHGHLVQALISLGVRTPDGSDVEDHLAALSNAAAWLDSPVFDTDRAALRLTGGAA